MIHLEPFPLQPFFECFSHPIVFIVSSTAIKTSEIFISAAFLFKIYPPFFPLTLVTILFFFNFKNNCSKYTNDIPCLRDMSLRGIGFLGSNLAISANAITAYLPLLDNFIFAAILLGLYIYPTNLVKIITHFKTCILSLNFDRKI